MAIRSISIPSKQNDILERMDEPRFKAAVIRKGLPSIEHERKDSRR